MRDRFSIQTPKKGLGTINDMPSPQNMSRLIRFRSYSGNWDLREVFSLLRKGGWTLNWPFSQNLVYFPHMSSSNFRPLRGAYDLWKSCSKYEAESIKHFIQGCLRANTAENMSYHILKSGILSFLLETCVSAKTKVVQWVKPSNCLRYSWVRFPQKTWLTRFDDFCSNLDMRISLLLEGKPVYRQ